MEVQHAAGAANTKQPASPKRAPSEPGDPSTAVNPTSTSNPDKSPPPRPTPTSAAKDPKVRQDEGANPDRDSEAETIVLPGRDGESPSKPRKTIKHEEKSDGEVDDISPAPKIHFKDGERAGGLTDDAASASAKKRRLLDFQKEKQQQQRSKDGSSGLSSAPTSPSSHHRSQGPSHQRRRSRDAHSTSDSEYSKYPPSRPTNKDKPRSVDRLLPGKRKAPKADSDDEAESRKIRRPRNSDTSVDRHPASRPRDSKPPSTKPPYDKHATPRARSNSPHARQHRRSLSTQLPSQSSNGFSSKKKRIPAPLQSTDYHSDESSASGSPHPRSSKLKTQATPVTGDSTVSPAKMAPHKKHLDAHGQTLFAKACAKGEYDTAKIRLGERPEDLNFADHAGNTPLQVASLNGHEDIVRLLVNAGCNLECRNDVKDTPLLDAVENGHLGVVKTLLAAGVNPRKPNAEGQEPLEKIPDDLENAEEIRAALTEAKQKRGELRRASEDHLLGDGHEPSSRDLESPRRSPHSSMSSALAAQRRGGAVRSTKTSNHLLYMSLDDKTLRHAAARGDQETVTRILQVKESCDDAEALVAAARGGHDVVMELLLALGGANPDPSPVKSLPIEHGTPMLAAIGQENTKVIQLLLEQSGFDPTRRFKGHTYYEIARRREGPMWKEEEHMLRNAYDEYKRNKASATTRSPARRDRDRDIFDQDHRRNARKDSSQDVSRSHKRHLSSPSRDGDSKKKLGSGKAPSSPKEKRRSSSLGNHHDQTSPKRGPGRPKKEDAPVLTSAVSDREASPSVSSKGMPAKPRRGESDLFAGSSEGESVKPRRKLVSGRDLKGHREQQRRVSLVPASSKEALDRGDTKHEEILDKGRSERLSEKYHDRTKALKRDESRDRLPTGDSTSKRHRSSVTPPRRVSSERDDSEVPLKRRKLDVDGKDKRSQHNSSPDDRQYKRDMSRDSVKRLKTHHDDRKDPVKIKKINRERLEGDKSSPSEKTSITVFPEERDVDTQHAPPAVTQEQREAQAKREHEESKKRKAEQEVEAKRKAEERKRAEEQKKKLEEEERRQKEEAERKQQEEERRRREAEEKKQREEAEKIRLEKERKQREEERRQREEEVRKQREEEERKRREEEEKRREEEERKRREEEERKRREEEEKKRLEEEEKRRLEEEERKRQQEEERRRREEEERQRREEMERKQREEEERKRQEEERRRREEEERKQREEEERLRREKEAAEEARRIREEEERKERERKRAAAQQAEMLRIRQQQEKARLAKLPPLLRWLDQCPDPKQKDLAERFAIVQGVRYDTIEPLATGKPDGREQWLLNTQVALLLGEKDLSLSRYTAWDRRPVSDLAKRVIWRVEQDRYALTEGKLYHLGEQLDDYYGGNPSKVGYRTLEQLRGEASKLFFEMEMFFVKESDFLFIVPTVPHLRNVRLSICYRELPEYPNQLTLWKAPAKWKQDPDAPSREGFAPRTKYYINGQFVSEDRPGHYRPSRDPFPEPRIPRRGGIIAVSPEEPDFPRLCVEQGLSHLLTEQQKQLLTNGAHLTPRSMTSTDPGTSAAGNLSPSKTSPSGASPATHVNGDMRGSSPAENLVNGIESHEIPS